MDIYQVLQRDHLKLKGLFDEIIKRVDTDQWEEVYDLYSCLKAEMITHDRAEEDTFYCFLVDENNNEDTINWECNEEHHVIALMIISVGQVRMKTTDWVTRFKHLHQNVVKHIDGEEDSIFKKARSMFSALKLSRWL
jgi:hemerythrin superfamily protein